MKAFFLVALLILSTTMSALAQVGALRPPQRPRERIMVMVIRGQKIPVSDEDLRNQARDVLESHLHADVVTNEETFVQGGTSFQKMLEDCRGEAPCYARLVGSVDARYLLVVSTRAVRDLIVLGTRMIDLDVQKVIGKAIGRISKNTPLLEAILPQLEKTIPENMWDPYGSLSVQVDKPGAAITVRGAMIGLSPKQRLDNLLPEDYNIMIHLDGYKVQTRTVKVRRNALTPVEFTLTEAVEILSKWWFWTGLAVLAISGIAMGVIISDQGPPIFCSSPDPDVCP